MARVLDQEDVARIFGTDAAGLRAVWTRARGPAQVERDMETRALETVTARIDAGRWVVDCPLCRGAEVVSKQTRVFFCMSCRMAAGGGRQRLVIFPADIGAAEAAVAGRPVRERYWPG